MARNVFQYNPDDKLDVQKLLKIMKPQFAPVKNVKQQCQEIVMAKLIAFMKAVKGQTVATRLGRWRCVFKDVENANLMVVMYLARKALKNFSSLNC